MRPEIRPHDPRWADQAAELLAALAREVAQAQLGEHDLQHIGSTSVPDLPAKPFLDLQLRLPTLPDDAVLDALVARVGFAPTEGSNPDSPGVRRDHPRGDEDVPGEAWVKRLYVREDPGAVLHVRRHDSPFGRHTVDFRDWLRAHPERAGDYAATKQRLAERFGGDGHPDNYTRAKTTYFDEVHPVFTQWARERGRAGRG